MGVRVSRNVSAVKGANVWPHAKLLFAALIFCILFLAACNDEEESVTPPPAPPAPPAAGPDLTITIISIADAGILGWPALENLATVSFTVSNGGTLATDGSAFWVDFFGNISPAPVLGAVGEGAIQLSPGVIAVGATVPQIVNFATSASSGAAYTIVDSQGDAIAESNEGNNVSTTFGWSFPRPDLSVVINSITPDCCGNATVNFTITNNGPAATDLSAYWLDFFPNPPGAPLLGEISTSFLLLDPGPVIAAGASLPITNLFFLEGFLIGTAYLIVDSLEAITEMDETNNVSTGIPWL